MVHGNAVVIGGGLGGLAVGSYLLMNGYRTHILEMANQCGGIAVSWRRKGYLFDGATNYLPGSSPRLNAHRILGDILDFRELNFYDYPEFIQIEKNGETFHVYTDADRLRAEMLRISPEDRKTIDIFIDAVRELGKYSLPFEQAPETFSIGDALRFLRDNFGLLMFRGKWGNISVAAFASRFKNPLMREMFKQIFPHHEHFAVMAPMAPLAWMNRKAAGYPLGGSEKIAGMMEKRYRSLGGTIEFFKTVKSIDRRGRRARGVTCEDGSSYHADIVVSSADLYSTIHHLLPGVPRPQKFVKKFARYRPFTALHQISLGIARTFEGEAEKLNIPADPPIRLAEENAHDMMVRILNFDQSFAPKGKTSVVVQLRTEEWKHWVDLRKNDRETYKKEKARIAEAVIKVLERRFGNIRKKVEVVDVATPATYVRYTGSYHGAHQGWAPTPGVIGRPQPKTVPGIENLYLSGHWLSPAGGIPAVIAVGRQVVQIICRREKRPFQVLPHKPKA